MLLFLPYDFYFSSHTETFFFCIWTQKRKKLEQKSQNPNPRKTIYGPEGNIAKNRIKKQRQKKRTKTVLFVEMFELLV